MCSQQDRKRIVGVGSALVDILIRESEEFLAASVAAKGGMRLVDKGVIEGILASSSSRAATVPGGSACNTLVGIGRLGGPARFVGKRGSDPLGEMLEKDLMKSNVEPLLFRSDTHTGRVLSIITPDAQRSMLTFLGAASELRPEELKPKCFEGAALVHIEGYLLFDEGLMRAALTAAREAGAKISLDLASYTVVEASRALLTEIARDYVDVLIANEDEARAFTGHGDEMKALEALAGTSEIAALKVGKRGSFISMRDRVTRVGIVGTGDAVDTTGAGDLWAAGFLYGLVNGYSTEKCGALAAACGYEVCSVIGAAIPEDGWARIKTLI